MDPWGLAALVQENEAQANLSKIVFKVNLCGGDKDPNHRHLEAFKRRLSFLDFNNNQDLNIELIVNDTPEQLYSEIELFQRPAHEIIRDNVNTRGDKDKAGKIEKDFQTFLFGKGNNFENDQRTNERLAVLGHDFFDLKGKKLNILREFPTGVFKDQVAKDNALLSTDFIDMVTLNKYRELSIIELKLNNSELEIISQMLDYALFCKAYYKQLLPLFSKELDVNLPKESSFTCYMANNHFHPRLERIERFYRTHHKAYGFKIKQVILGYTKDLDKNLN